MSRFAVLLVLMACGAVVWIQTGANRLTEYEDERRNRRKADDLKAQPSKAACPPDCPSDCQDWYDMGFVSDARRIVHLSTDDMREVIVYCDAEIGNGWTVFQSRVIGETDFYRNWTEYESVFGFMTEPDFWMGNNDLYYFLAQKNYRMRFELQDFDGVTAYADYDNFTIGSAENFYSLNYDSYSGTAGNSLQTSGSKFTTFDVDHDISPTENCAETHHGAWWYEACGNSNLNGQYNLNKTDCVHTNNFWYTFRQYCPLKYTTIKFRPM